MKVIWPVLSDWNLQVVLFPCPEADKQASRCSRKVSNEACLSGSWKPAQQKGRVAIREWRMLEANMELLCLWPRLTIAVEGQTREAWHRARAVTVWTSESRQLPRSAVSPEWRTANLHCLSCQLLPSHNKEYKVTKVACVSKICSFDWSRGQEDLPLANVGRGL